MSTLESAGRGPVYRASLKDVDGFPTVVVAGPAPQRGRVWLYVHGNPPTVLPLHPPVVRFLLQALTEVARWLDQPQDERVPLVWTLPRSEGVYPECVLVASYQRAWLHVFAATASLVRLNERTVQFLLDALSDLPTWRADRAHRWTSGNAGEAVAIGPAQIDELAGTAR